MIAALVPLVAALVTVRVDTSHRIATVRPLSAVGVGIDSDPKGKIPLLYSRPRVDRMLAAGLGMVSYRLYTELSIEDWHWNPNGSYSDAAHARGYWTSSARPDARQIVDSYGYRLPHRGSSRDQGDDDDYSRIDDGDAATYWKSDPYLTSRYTGEPDAAHPQWVIVDLGSVKPVDTVSVAWANPYATSYRVQYWRGEGDAIADEANGTWQTFPQGAVDRAPGGTVVTHLSKAPVPARWVRVLMTASSNTCDTHGSYDVRNCVGYAVSDIGVGTADASGAFHDDVVRSTCGGDPASSEHCSNDQTLVWTSSDDPWHSENDRVKGDQDQPGLDIVSTSGISRGKPMMYPVPVFYSTPENAANELSYLEARRYPISYVEMGEEIDGQYATPEDYGALFIQFADALHRVDPHVKLGGPIFSGFNTDLQVWRDASGKTSWLARFVDYLRARGKLGDLAFMSFEHYPFHACDAGDQLQDDLLREPDLIRNMVRIFRGDGIPASVPLFVTESNFAADGGAQAQHIDGALWIGDYVASALSSGISGITYYQYETEPLGAGHRCASGFGSYGLFLVGDDYTIYHEDAAFYAAQMLAREWLQFGDAPQGIYPVSTSLGSERAAVTAYAVRRPDGSWSLLLDNKSFTAERIDVRGLSGYLSGAQFGEAQYQWSGQSPSEAPMPDTGISRAVTRQGAAFVLEPRSLTVLRFQYASAR